MYYFRDAPPASPNVRAALLLQPYVGGFADVDSRVEYHRAVRGIGILDFSNSKFAAVSPIRSRGWATELSCGSVSRADCDSEKPITAICSGMR